MKIPNLITSSRLALSPLFFIFYFFPQWTGTGRLLSLVLLWITFILIEVSDLIDGKIARKLDQVSDTGKLLDPFADSLSRLTYFFCFTVSGLMPPFVFLLVLYRDLAVSFIRLVIARQGIAMAARLSGKIKAVIYAAAGVGGLLFVTVQPFFGDAVMVPARTALLVLFVLTGITALWTLIDYSRPFLHRQQHDRTR